MAVSKSNQRPILRVKLVHLVSTFSLVRQEALRTGEFFGRRLEEQEEAVATEGVPAWQHPWYALHLFPLI